MGSMIEIYCKDCISEADKKGIKDNTDDMSYNRLYLGIGMMFSPHNVFYGNTQFFERAFIYDEVSEENIQQDIKRLLGEGATPGDEYDKCIYYCEHCQSFEIKFYFTLETGSKIYEPIYKCGLCSKPLQMIPDDRGLESIKKMILKCRKCGGSNFVIEDVGCWD